MTSKQIILGNRLATEEQAERKIDRRKVLINVPWYLED